MMKHVPVVLPLMFLLFSSSTFAGDITSASDSVANSSSVAVSHSIGTVSQTQGGQSITIDDHSKVDAKTAIAPNLGGLATTPYSCMGSSQIAVGTQGIFAFGAGTTWRDKECDKREAIKLSIQMGDRELAYKLLYDLEVVKEVLQKERSEKSDRHAYMKCTERTTLFGGTTLECEE